LCEFTCILEFSRKWVSFFHWCLVCPCNPILHFVFPSPIFPLRVILVLFVLRNRWCLQLLYVLSLFLAFGGLWWCLKRVILVLLCGHDGVVCTVAIRLVLELVVTLVVPCCGRFWTVCRQRRSDVTNFKILYLLERKVPFSLEGFAFFFFFF